MKGKQNIKIENGRQSAVVVDRSPLIKTLLWFKREYWTYEMIKQKRTWVRAKCLLGKIYIDPWYYKW